MNCAVLSSIKRRLAQKMDFLAADLAAIDEPTDAELADWYGKNSDRFALPPHASFRHLYFSPDKRGNAAEQDAADALASMAGKQADAAESQSLGDPFMLRDFYGDATPAQTAKEFGPAFAQAVFGLKPGAWQGPVPSGYGWHLVWVDSLEPGRVPPYEEVKADVKAAWLDNRYQEVKRNALAEMRSRYTVVVTPLDSVDLEDLGAKGGDAAQAEQVSQ
jgi:peptidyl-prolyl cis-trans isomerase C